MTRKTTKYEWADNCEEAFLEFKEKLTSAAVLELLGEGEHFVVYCGALRSRVGCVLMQEGRLIAYTSR